MHRYSAPLLALLPLLGWSTTAAADTPNILVIIADDLGSDKVDSFSWAGGSTTILTPTLDALAASGVSFDNAWANPGCSPTRAALHTGEHAFRSGIGSPLAYGSTDGLPPATTYLPGLVQSAGYTTALFGKWHLGAEGSVIGEDWTTGGVTTNVGQPPPIHIAGYDHYDGYIDGAPHDFDSWPRVVGSPSDWDVITEPGYVDEVTVNVAAEWIDLQEDPWLAVVALAAPHASGISTYDEDDVLSDSACTSPVLGAGCFSDPTLECAEDTVYHGLVECMDERLDDFLGGLDLTDTLVIVLGDNGTPGDVMELPYSLPAIMPPLFGHVVGKGTPFQTGVRVPLLVADGEAFQTGGAPAVLGGTGVTVLSPTQVLDVFPTILDVAGAAAAPTDGKSLSPCLSAPTAMCLGPTLGLTSRVQYSEEFGAFTGEGTVRRGAFKLVATLDPVASCMETELFNVGTDPHELTDLNSVNLPMCLGLRGAVEGIEPTWMVDDVTGNIEWCPTSCI